MPYAARRINGKNRVVTIVNGRARIAKNRAGTPVDGGGHSSMSKAAAQARVINAREGGYPPRNSKGPKGSKPPKGMRRGVEHGRKIRGKYRYIPRGQGPRLLKDTTKTRVNKARKRKGLAPRR